MKKLLIVCAIVLSFGASCKKKTIDPQTGLPVATQTGANTFAAHVNGESWVAGYSRALGSFNAPVNLSYSGGLFVLSIAVDNNNSYPLFVSRLNITLVQGQTYSLQTTSINTDAMSLVTSVNGIRKGYTVAPPLTGQMVITKFDPSTKVVSGTLSFDLVDSAGEKIEVRDGWFDVKYQ